MPGDAKGDLVVGAPLAAAATLNVLVVDDDAFLRKGARIIPAPESCPHRIRGELGARRWKCCLRADNPPIDLVFLDLFMPKMDGIEVLRHIEPNDHTPTFVFVSGVNSALLTTAVHLATARGLPVLGALEKPLSQADVDLVLKLRRERRKKPRLTVGGFAIPPDELVAAIHEKWLELHYQPKVNLKTMEIVGFEALVRLRHPVFGLIPPGIFIPLAEESNLIGPITAQVLTLALEQSTRWKNAGLDTTISVNISAKMLVDLGLPDRMEQDALRCGAKPDGVILEITESGLFADEGDSLDILARLCMKGFHLSIDDFGTGYSSMEQLRRVPFAELKIDRAFVNGVTPNSKDYSILDSSVALGKKLGLKVVAEGAETAEDMEMLAAVGADVVQGYHIAKPIPADDVLPWARNWRLANGGQGAARALL